MVRVFVTQPVAASALTRLRTIAEVTVNPDASCVIAKDTLIAGTRACDILFSLLHDPVDGEVIAANPALRAITSMSITPDNIDVAAATARRIPVTVVPALAVEFDRLMFTLPCCSRWPAASSRAIRPCAPGFFRDRSRATCSVPGSTARPSAWSAAAAASARRWRRGRAAFPCASSIAGRSPWRTPTRSVSAPNMCPSIACSQRAKISSRCIPTAATRHMIAARELSLMKPTAYLINTSRGAVVDEAALAAALAERRIAGAGLDVFENEPHVAPALTGLANVVLTPHLGSAVVEVRAAMAEAVVDNIAAILAGRTPPNIVNPEVLAP